MSDPNADLISLLTNQDPDDDLDLTNLIDLFSMLSVLFLMLISPLAAISSTLTVLKDDEPAGHANGAVVIRLTGDSNVLLNDAPLQLEDLGRRLETLQKTVPGLVVRLAADRDAKYGQGLQIRAILNKLKIPCQEVGRLSQE